MVKIKLPQNIWAKIAVLVGLAAVVLLAVVLAARGLRELSPVQDFIAQYPGTPEPADGQPVGIPAWVGWQHFFNAFFLILLIRTGWLIRTVQRPSGYWTRRNTGLFKTKNPPKKLSLYQWMHLSIDALWVLNGLVFYVLLFSTGQWLRLIPTDSEIFQHAISGALQYASLDWPLENAWVNYNGLQQLAYTVTVFIASPLAVLTGLRMSPIWPQEAKFLNKVYPIEVARAVHFPTMVYFAIFIVGHVALVFATGALRNLNHMFASSDSDGWAGFWIFLASMAVIIAGWVLARPMFMRPIAALTGKVSK